MFFHTVLVCLVVLGHVSAELVLEKDVVETVTFDGSELVIEVDNSGGVEGRFTLCIKTSEQVSSSDCPTGYQRIQFSFGRVPMVKIFKMNRQGRVMMGTGSLSPIQSIFFTEDDALDVVLKEVPDQSTKVKLLNAVRYVPPEPVETTTFKKSGSMAIFSVVVIVLLAISGLLIAGLMVLICYCRRRTPQKMIQSDERSQKHKMPNSLKADENCASLPPKPMSRRTSSTTVTNTILPVNSTSSVVVFPVQNIQSNSSMTTVKTTPPHAKPIPSASSFNTTFPK